MTLEEVEFAMGTPDLVRALRTIGAIQPVRRHGQTLIFDAGAMANVWARFVAGEYEEELAREREHKGKLRRK
jgi:hypothetical protein